MQSKGDTNRGIQNMKFEDILRDNNIEYRTTGQHEHARPGWIQIDCCHCSKDWKRFYMGYNVRGNYINCYYCGRHGLTETVSELLGISFTKARILLNDLDQESPIEKIVRTKLVLPDHIKPLLPCHKEYLIDRGFDWRNLVKLWEIKGIGLSPNLGYRIFIPIFQNGKMVSWTTRSIGDKHGGRYISSSPDQEAVNHKEVLYGVDYCRNACLVVEGPTDVWNVGPGAVCTFGTGFSRSQLEKVSRYPKRGICYDSEPAAQRVANQLCDLLSVFPGETVNIVLDAKDPGSASKKEIQQLRKHFLEA